MSWPRNSEWVMYNVQINDEILGTFNLLELATAKADELAASNPKWIYSVIEETTIIKRRVLGTVNPIDRNTA